MAATYKKAVDGSMVQAKNLAEEYKRLQSSQESNTIYYWLAQIVRDLVVLPDAEVKDAIRQQLLGLVENNSLEEGTKLPLADMAEYGILVEQFGLEYILIGPNDEEKEEEIQHAGEEQIEEQFKASMSTQFWMSIH
ncbi:hypothetical protein OROMI_024373 [Orobanche minor]